MQQGSINPQHEISGLTTVSTYAELWESLKYYRPFRFSGNWGERLDLYRKNSELSLDLKSNGSTKRQIDMICDAVSNSNTISECIFPLNDLLRCDVSDGYSGIAKMISNPSCIINHLEVTNGRFSLQEAKLLGEAFKINKSLEILDIYSENFASSEVFVSIFEGISQSESIKILSIPCLADDDGENSSGDTLPSVLSIISNDSLCRIQVLDYLALDFNEDFGDLFLLCSALETNTSIHTIAIDFELDLVARVFARIDELLCHNFTLHSLCFASLHRNHFEESIEEINEVRKKLKRNKKIFLIKYRVFNYFLLLKSVTNNNNFIDNISGNFPADVSQYILNILVELLLKDHDDSYFQFLNFDMNVFKYGEGYVYPFNRSHIYRY